MVAGRLRLHDTWHVSSRTVSRSPATVLEPRMLQLHIEIENDNVLQKRNYAEPRTWAVWGKRPENSRFAVRVVDAKATADLLLDDIVWSVGAGIGYLLVNCGA